VRCSLLPSFSIIHISCLRFQAPFVPHSHANSVLPSTLFLLPIPRPCTDISRPPLPAAVSRQTPPTLPTEERPHQASHAPPLPRPLSSPQCPRPVDKLSPGLCPHPSTTRRDQSSCPTSQAISLPFCFVLFPSSFCHMDSTTC